MTTREKLESILQSRGLFPQQAKEVMDICVNDEQLNSSHISWNQPSEGYPDSLYSVLMMRIGEITLEWIDQNNPLAWFRPMFDHKQMEEIEKNLNSNKF